jgi:hypothetical protein
MPLSSKRKAASKENGGKKAKPGTPRGRPVETSGLLQKHGAVLLMPYRNASNHSVHEAMDYLDTNEIKTEIEAAVKKYLSRKDGASREDSVIFQKFNVGQEGTTIDVGDKRRVQVRINDLKGVVGRRTLKALETCWNHLQESVRVSKMTSGTETDNRTLLTLREDTPQLLIALPGAGDQDLHTDGTPWDADIQQLKFQKQHRGRPQVAAILTLTSPHRTLLATPYSAQADCELTSLKETPTPNATAWTPSHILRVAIPHRAVFMFKEDFIHAGTSSERFNLSMHAFFDNRLGSDSKKDNATWPLQANIPDRIWKKFYSKVGPDVIQVESSSFPERVQVVCAELSTNVSN